MSHPLWLCSGNHIPLPSTHVSPQWWDTDTGSSLRPWGGCHFLWWFGLWIFNCFQVLIWKPAWFSLKKICFLNNCNKINEKKLSKRGEVAGGQSLSHERSSLNCGSPCGRQNGQDGRQGAMKVLRPWPSELIILLVTFDLYLLHVGSCTLCFDAWKILTLVFRRPYLEGGGTTVLQVRTVKMRGHYSLFKGVIAWEQISGLRTRQGQLWDVLESWPNFRIQGSKVARQGKNAACLSPLRISCLWLWLLIPLRLHVPLSSSLPPSRNHTEVFSLLPHFQQALIKNWPQGFYSKGKTKDSGNEITLQGNYKWNAVKSYWGQVVKLWRVTWSSGKMKEQCSLGFLAMFPCSGLAVTGKMPNLVDTDQIQRLCGVDHKIERKKELELVL